VEKRYFGCSSRCSRPQPVAWDVPSGSVIRSSSISCFGGLADRVVRKVQRLLWHADRAVAESRQCELRRQNDKETFLLRTFSPRNICAIYHKRKSFLNSHMAFLMSRPLEVGLFAYDLCPMQLHGPMRPQI